MPASTGDRAKNRRRRYRTIDFRTSRIVGGSLHDPSHGQDQSPDEIFVRDRRFQTEARSGFPVEVVRMPEWYPV